MWKPTLEMKPVDGRNSRTSDGVMAHRRCLGGSKLLSGACLFLMVGFLLAGSVVVSNRVTGLRAEIARLENRREFLEAGSARLLTVWNKATAPTMIITRAERELGLVVPTEPGLVLVQVPSGEQGVSAWRRLLENMSGGDELQAAELNPRWVMGSMVSLTPRPTTAHGGR